MRTTIGIQGPHVKLTHPEPDRPTTSPELLAALRRIIGGIDPQSVHLEGWTKGEDDTLAEAFEALLANCKHVVRLEVEGAVNLTATKRTSLALADLVCASVTDLTLHSDVCYESGDVLFEQLTLRAQKGDLASLRCLRLPFSNCKAQYTESLEEQFIRLEQLLPSLEGLELLHLRTADSLSADKRVLAATLGLPRLRELVLDMTECCGGGSCLPQLTRLTRLEIHCIGLPCYDQRNNGPEFWEDVAKLQDLRTLVINLEEKMDGQQSSRYDDGCEYADSTRLSALTALPRLESLSLHLNDYHFFYEDDGKLERDLLAKELSDAVRCGTTSLAHLDIRGCQFGLTNIDEHIEYAVCWHAAERSRCANDVAQGPFRVEMDKNMDVDMDELHKDYIRHEALQVMKRLTRCENLEVVDMNELVCRFRRHVERDHDDKVRFVNDLQTTCLQLLSRPF